MMMMMKYTYTLTIYTIKLPCAVTLGGAYDGQSVRLKTSAQSNLTKKSHIAAAPGRFIRIRQLAPMCTPSNTCFPGST